MQKISQEYLNRALVWVSIERVRSLQNLSLDNVYNAISAVRILNQGSGDVDAHKLTLHKSYRR